MSNRLSIVHVGLVVAALLSPHSAFAQEPSNADLKKEIEALSTAMKAMQTDLQEIKALLQRGAQPAAPPQNFTLDLGTNAFKGEKTARLTMVEFTDYQCPFCSRYARDTFPQIEKDYIAKALEPWSGHAEAIGLDVPQFEACLGSGKHAAEIRRDMAQAQSAGVTGTPGFFLAVTDPASTKVKTLRVLKGAQPYANFKAQIDALLEEQGTTAKKNP
jgi:protein-disulfide isomerase